MACTLCSMFGFEGRHLFLQHLSVCHPFVCFFLFLDTKFCGGVPFFQHSVIPRRVLCGLAFPVDVVIGGGRRERRV